jgi:hypothetical protein
MQIEPNPRKTAAFRDLGRVDVSALQTAVAQIPESVWDAENAAKPNRFGALDATRHIIFRFVSSLSDWRNSYDGATWPHWRALVEPVLEQATRAYGYARGAYPRAMLARMPAQGVIHPHRDANLAAKWPHKIHVPLFTNENVIFYVENEARHLRVGEAVEVNNMGVHAVRNNSDAERIHLIFEYYDLDQPEPSWLAGTPIA